MEIDLSKYTLEELEGLKNNINNYIHSYQDGYLYICKVRSYGRNWTVFVGNHISLQNLCDEYDGENGVIDVYSNNPNLSNISNYGKVKYIKSQEDYEKWYNYETLKDFIPTMEKDLDNWENRSTMSFNDRPMFSPGITREELDKFKKELADYDMSFTPPKDYTSL